MGNIEDSISLDSVADPDQPEELKLKRRKMKKQRVVDRNDKTQLRSLASELGIKCDVGEEPIKYEPKILVNT